MTAMGDLERRVDMMLTRAFLRATLDDSGIQRMQVGALEGETIDNCERFQTYGLSSVPPSGGDCLLGCISGNRDHPVVIAVNDRGSRPRGVRTGEVVLYNNANVTVLLNADGELVIRAKRVTIETDEDVSIKAGQPVSIDGDLNVSGTITADTVNAPNGNVGGGP